MTHLFYAALPAGIPYAEAKRRVRTFDLVYFCHLATWTGPFVAVISGKLITHMGMMYREPSTGDLYVLESVRHADTACDVASHNRVHTGVRLVPLLQKLNDTAGRYFVCVQPVRMDDATRHAAEAKMPEFIRTHVNLPFEQNVPCFLGAHLDRNSRWYTPEDTTSLYCSELAALALRECGLLTVDNVSAVWHTYFWCNKLVLNPGAHLSADKFLINMQLDRVLAAASMRTLPCGPLASLSAAAATAAIATEAPRTRSSAPVIEQRAPSPQDDNETGDEMVARIRSMGGVSLDNL